MEQRARPRLRHFALFVEDIEKMEAFYGKVMGLTVTDRGPFPNPDVDVDMVFMSSDPQEHHEFVLCTGRPKDVDFALNQQMSFLVNSLDELKEVYNLALAETGQDIRCVTHGNAWSIYFKDPEGNGIEIYLRTPWYIPQPHSFPIDLTLSNAEIERLTEEHCREDPGFMMATEREAKMAEMMGLT